MTGSSRLVSTDTHSVRAPYSAPQMTAPSVVPPTRNFDPDTGAAIRFPEPFIPREFRTSVRSDVTVVPAVEHSDANATVSTQVSTTATPIAVLFNDDATPATDFAAFIESHDIDEAEANASAELPWIDAFAAEPPAVTLAAPELDEEWPLGEAGKRLDELTQSLSSLDASRERMQAERLSAEGAPTAAPDAALPMWNEEEWIDIMPTSSADMVSHDMVSHDMVSHDVVSHNELSHNELSHNELSQSVAKHDETPKSESSDLPRTTLNAESAARALEGLAQRVRAGELRVPAFPTELGQEAMLAGLLASMLGWRQ